MPSIRRSGGGLDRIHPPTASPADVARAAALIRAGQLVAFPTETVYGLGADATNDRAVAAIFSAKARPRINPLIIHVADPEQAAGIGRFDRNAGRLATALWPGPLTLVLPRTRDCPVSLLACAGLDTVALRVPANPIAVQLIVAAGRPIAAPSANPSGSISPTRAADVAATLGDRVAMILDGGPCAVGIESTVLDLTARPARLLRPGGVDRAAIEPIVGPLGPVVGDGDGAPRSPGMGRRHYAPRRPLRLDVRDIRDGEALLAFGPHACKGYAAVRNLSPGGDLAEAAANLFSMMRELDRPQYTAIAVMDIPDQGLGEAINDRLRRAAFRE